MSATEADAKALLDAIAARPRPAGGDAERAARARCARLLEGLGFEVEEQPFEYSAFPGRWATPAAGVALLAALLGGSWLGAHGAHALALGVFAGVPAAVAAASLAAARAGVLRLPVMRASSSNLVAVRGAPGGRPPLWLVAHLDSKSQPVPILVRALGIVATAALVVAAIGAAIAGAAGLVGEPWAGWRLIAALAPAATAPVILSVVGSRSQGALDDASGVATVLLAATLAPAAMPLGVLLTSAEELGLAGARAWARGRQPAIALNCDGVDDAGSVVAMHGARAPRALLGALDRASGGAVRTRRLLPGILADSVALADAGWDAVTVSRGTAATLARIHRPADAPERLTGAGIAGTARLLAAAAAELVPARAGDEHRTETHRGCCSSSRSSSSPASSSSRSGSPGRG